MNKAVKGLLFIIIASVILFLAIKPKIFSSNESPSGTNEVRSTPPVMTVDAIVAKPSNIDNKILVTGSVIPNEAVEITSEISGKIKKIYFNEGQRVKKGDLMVSINDDELRAQLEKLRYNQKLWEDTEFRQRKLLEREAISQEEYEQALTQLNTSTADIKVVEAQLDKTKIRAPFNGHIGLRMVSEGAYITPNEPITSLYNLDPAKIDFSIPGKYSSQVSVGKKIRFTIDGLDGTFEGSVYAIEPQIDPRTRTLKMRAKSPNKDEKLVPGQFTKIELILESLEDVLMVPTQSVIPELEGSKIYMVENGKVASVQVETGIRTESEIQLVSGVNIADTILTSGILQVRPGLEVNVNITNAVP